MALVAGSRRDTTLDEIARMIKSDKSTDRFLVDGIGISSYTDTKAVAILAGRHEMTDGDILLIPGESVIAIATSGWPVAITVEFGELSSTMESWDEIAGGIYYQAFKLAAQIAKKVGYEVRPNFALEGDPVKDAFERAVSDYVVGHETFYRGTLTRYAALAGISPETADEKVIAHVEAQNRKTEPESDGEISNILDLLQPVSVAAVRVAFADALEALDSGDMEAYDAKLLKYAQTAGISIEVARANVEQSEEPTTLRSYGDDTHENTLVMEPYGDEEPFFTDTHYHVGWGLLIVIFFVGLVSGSVFGIAAERVIFNVIHWVLGAELVGFWRIINFF